MSVLRELGRDIVAEQDRRLLASVRPRAVQELGDAALRTPGHGLLAWWLAGSSAAALGVMAAVSLWTARAEPLLQFRVPGGVASGANASWIAASDAPMPLEFSDGSRLVLAPRARARVKHLAKTGADLEVEQGSVNVSIVPRPGNHWRLDLGPFVVRVTGTRFEVDWDPETERLTLTMHEGKVNVSGCTMKERPFAAGEVLEVSCREQTIEISALGRKDQIGSRAEESAAPSPPESSPAPPPAKARPSPASGNPEVSLPRPPLEVKGEAKSDHNEGRLDAVGWKTLAEAGRYREALAVANAAGFEAVCRRVSAADLLSLAGAARLAGDAGKARQAYLILRQRFPTDPAAALAAFHLARIAFDVSSDYPGAARWFETYAREAPEGSLVPEAYGRRLEALHRSGDAATARREAVEYVARYPTGPHAEFARRLAH